jgi:hypothetical protein
MSTTREQALAALLAAVTAQGYFTTTGRRARDPSVIGPLLSPACFLVRSGETLERKSPNLVIRTLHVSAFVYNDVGAAPNAIPETVLNNAMEALEAALAPAQPGGLCTLGGLVYAAYLKGEVHTAPAELTGKALAIVPIEIVLP